VEFLILGPLEAVHEGRRIEIGGRKQRALLAALVLRANEVVQTDRLVELVWGDSPPAAGAKAVQIHVSRLRRALAADDVLQTRAGGYVLATEPESIDLQRFEAGAAEGRRWLAAGEPGEARVALTAALGLWRGPALGDLLSEPFAQRESARLEELQLAAREDRIEADIALGAHAAVVPELEALVARHPLRERLREQLILALYRCGRQAEALESYRQARSALVGELGIEPGRRLQQLEQAVLRQDPALDAARVAAVETTRPGRQAAGVFVGRVAELAELGAGLADAAAGRGRLFLVSGESGAGKTRLVDELASAAKAGGARVLWGRCWKDGGAPALWPWRQALRSIGELQEDADRFARFEQATAFLRSIDGPVLLVLEDVHAADVASLELLGDLAGELAELPVLLVATYLAANEPPSGLEALAHHAAHHRLPLRPLDAGEVAQFVERIGAHADPAVLLAETGGNPRLLWQRLR
jgi:DNA-binding SARP family transcriptional activator